MTDTPLLELRCITKTFGSVEALSDVDLEVRHGEVMALVGDNGAGKSTLIKCIAGAHTPDSGEILFDGKEVSIHGPKDAAKLGHRGRVPGPRPLRQPRRRPEHVPGPRGAQLVPAAERAGDGVEDGRDAEDPGRHDDPLDPAARRHALGRAATVGRRRPGGDVELEARHPRRADRRARRLTDGAGAGARPAPGRAGSRGHHHLPQPARHLRDRQPHHRSAPGTERRRLRAREDDAAGGRPGDHRRRAHEGRRHSGDRREPAS